MPGAIRFAAIVSATFGLACASLVDVNVEQSRDLAGCRTWNFLTLPSGNVRAGRGEARELDVALSGLLENGLRTRGFARVSARPDVFVSYLLQVRRQIVLVSETPAVEQLSSMNSSPSYEIQATEHRVESYEIGNLTVLVSDPDERAVIWRGEYAGRYRGKLAPHLEDAVASLLERFDASAEADAVRPGTCAPRSQAAAD